MVSAALIILIYIGVLTFSYRICGKNSVRKSIDEFIYAGKNISSVFLTPSIFNGWMWTTTIIGAAEAGVEYGFLGGFAYGIGAGLAFYLFIFFIMRFRKMMPGGIFITDFIGKRFSENTRLVFYVISIIVVLYIQIEMSAGLGFVFYGLFGVPFKFVAIIFVVIAIVFVNIAGMKRLLYNDLINFIIITVGFGALALIVVNTFDTKLLYEGMLRVQMETGNTEILSYFSTVGFRYLITAIFIGLAQLTVDPSYYLRATIAKDEKTIKRSFFFGGVFLFIPVAIISGIIFGSTSLALDLGVEEGGNSSIQIVNEIIRDNFGIPVHWLAAFILTAVAMTTLITTLMGIMSLATLDIYPRILNPDASDKDKLRFGRMLMTMIGIIGGLIAISLENISLLTMDVFCGIVFSAALGVLIIGFLSNKRLGMLAIIAMILGTVAGVTVWVILVAQISWFFGTLVSFAVPIVFLFFAGLFIKDRFNFHSLNM